MKENSRLIIVIILLIVIPAGFSLRDDTRNKAKVFFKIQGNNTFLLTTLNGQSMEVAVDEDLDVFDVFVTSKEDSHGVFSTDTFLGTALFREEDTTIEVALFDDKPENDVSSHQNQRDILGVVAYRSGLRNREMVLKMTPYYADMIFSQIESTARQN